MEDMPPRQADDHQRKHTWLNERITENRIILSSAQRKSFILSWVRFLTFVMIPIGAYASVSEDYTVGGTLILVGLVGFIVSVRFHARVRQRLQMAALTDSVLQESAAKLAGNVDIVRAGERPAAASEDIATFIARDSKADSTFPLSPQEIVDIDVFGTPLSLFGLLNRTSTPLGSRALANALVNPLAEKANIESRQTVVRWLADHPTERMRLMAAATGMRSLAPECDQFCSTVASIEPLRNRRTMLMAKWWAIAATIGFAVVGYRLSDGSVTNIEWAVAFAMVGVNITILRRMRESILPRIRPWLQLDDIVGTFSFFVKECVDEIPEEDCFEELKQSFTAAAAPAVLPALQRVLPFSFLGLAGPLHTAINYLTLWDLHVVLGLDRAVAQHRAQLRNALWATGQLEFLTSLAVYAWETSDAIFPSVEPESSPLQLTIDDGRHPLIAPTEGVANSVNLGAAPHTYVITGSNMSGKSTFLRMTGCNLVLAQIGAAVPARSMRLTPLQLMTDLRIRDDLARHESYFLAEVRQVKRMVEATGRHEPILALIDEPFRGTNSAERVAAAVSVVRSLTRGGGLHMVATHDEALTSLADGKTIANFHFAEKFDSEELVFDYRIHDGPSQTRNALRVLQMEGFPAELITEANQLARELTQQQKK